MEERKATSIMWERKSNGVYQLSAMSRPLQDSMLLR
jgi:hypothetical protein